MATLLYITTSHVQVSSFPCILTNICFFFYNIYYSRHAVGSHQGFDLHVLRLMMLSMPHVLIGHLHIFLGEISTQVF